MVLITGGGRRAGKDLILAFMRQPEEIKIAAIKSVRVTLGCVPLKGGEHLIEELGRDPEISAV